ncbi:Nucleotide/sugar transporter family protein [Gossypium australe]|uniref:Nucleotide/sugar transporter family protein n=1 Tax=Gossypium australe TaxID=47621 RepID=A0A5B6X5W1_9ROSI|nr:Nucleotide/sugar transporter family protein [Gossypium australe]
MGEMSSFQLGVIGALFLSVASSVSIVICNKALMSNLGFPFATTLTSWHLMVTFCTLHAAQRFNLFESKPIDMKTVVLFGILNGVSIGLLNLSLGFNSIGFYQAFIILSCIISVSVNFSTFLVIGKTSPVTYQVLGHLKTCLVLTFGYTLLHDPFTDRNIVGILIAIFGMGLYSYFCTQENKKKQADPLGSQMKEKDAAPFLGPQKEGHEVKNLNKDSLV